MRKLFKGRSTERDAFRIPRSVQQSIPIKRIYKDGIFRVSGRFSKTWRFFDINYAVASPEKQMELFLGYCGVLNSLPIDAGIKLTLVNRQLNRQEFSRNLLMAYRQDGRDYMRREYNGILLDYLRRTEQSADAAETEALLAACESEPVEVGLKQDIEIGPASIRCLSC